jgi:hypothetical protein
LFAFAPVSVGTDHMLVPTDAKMLAKVAKSYVRLGFGYSTPMFATVGPFNCVRSTGAPQLVQFVVST